LGLIDKSHIIFTEYWCTQNEQKWTQTLLQSIYCSKSPSKDMHINAHRMMKYEMKKNWNWKQVEIILWKEQRDRERKKINKEIRRGVEELDNDRTYKEMISISWNKR